MGIDLQFVQCKPNICSMWTFIVLLFVLTISEAKIPEVSPCPRLFTYEGTSLEADRWYGIITLLSTSDLNGIWLRIVFDRPIIKLGNWFGDVEKKGHADYLIKNPAFHLKAHSTKTIRFFVKYNIHEGPPMLQEFRINGKTVCPEDLVTTTPSTTTEHLFTSSDDEYETTSQKTQEPPINLNIDDIRSGWPDKQNLDDICGTMKLNTERRYEQVAGIGEFPWHASLYYTGITIQYICAASLISKQHIITAAHCTILSQPSQFVDPERLIVYLGKHYVKHTADHEGLQTRLVSDISVHPAYNEKASANDIAIMKLEEQVDFTDTVRPVCLWRGSTDFNAPKQGVIVGWGFDQNGDIQDELMYAQMNVHGVNVCYRSPIGNYLMRHMSNHTYCANFIDGTRSCVGDSGGGMVFPRTLNNKLVWQLRGIVSISVVLQHQLRCDRNHFAVFTDVTKYLDWIKDTI